MNVVFSLPGNIPVYAFPLLLGLGGVLGLGWVAYQASPREVNQRVDVGLWVMLGSLVGSRVGFVAVSWSYYRSNLWEAIALYQGGLSWPGALVGGVLTLILAARLIQAPTGKLADAMLPLIASLTISAWLGCWATGCAYGPPANQVWGIPAVDEWGHLAPRWPTQLIGALLTLGIFWVLDQSRNWDITPAWVKLPGVAAGLALFGLVLQMLALSFLRADPAPGWGGMRLDAWAALVLLVLITLILLFSFFSWNRSALEDSEQP